MCYEETQRVIRLHVLYQFKIEFVSMLLFFSFLLSQ